MNLDTITPKCFILAMFIRSDGERFLLGDGMFEFSESQLMFKENTFQNDIVEAQGADGVLLAGQVRRSAEQTFKGFVGDATALKTQIETARRQFLAFFRKNYFYEVVYIFPDGSAIKRQRGFITKAPSVQELYQVHPTYSISLNFEDVNYYSYEEDDSGQEIMNKSATVKLYNGMDGGWVQDDIGGVFDSVGAVFDGGSRGYTTLNIDSIATIYPTLVITGPAIDPSFENTTTGEMIQYTGTVRVGQTLKINMLEQTAKLGSVNVLTNISGTWVSLDPGVNRVKFLAEYDNTPNATLTWQEVVS